MLYDVAKEEKQCKETLRAHLHHNMSREGVWGHSYCLVERAGLINGPDHAMRLHYVEVDDESAPS